MTLRFVAEFDTEYVAITMTPVGEKQFPRCGIVREGRQFRRIVRIQRQCPGFTSIGEKLELIANGDDEIYVYRRRARFNT